VGFGRRPAYPRRGTTRRRSGSAGYSAAALLEETLDRTWKAFAAALTHEIVLDLGASRGIDCAAVFDVFASAVAFPRVSIFSGASATGPWSKRADLSTAGRRDWGGAWNAIEARYWKVEIQPQLLAESTLEVAYIALGLAAELPDAAALETTLDEQVEVNGSQATRFGEELASFDLTWRNLDGTEHLSLMRFKRLVGGAYRPFVLWPRDAMPGAVYLVRMGNSLAWSEDLDLYDGHGIQATEMERKLRG
jgi:hypothetical protein